MMNTKIKEYNSSYAILDSNIKKVVRDNDFQNHKLFELESKIRKIPQNLQKIDGKI